VKIIVCIKQVPDTTNVRIDPETNTLVREGVESIINPFDVYAIEEAVRLKERYGGETIVMTMGPPQAESALREAISVGADQGILISDRAFAVSDTWATSLVLARAARHVGDYDLIICGKQTADGDTAQTGPGIAAHLNLPQATYVRKIDEVDLESEPPTMTVERLLEDGSETLRVELPALITVVKEINEPRIGSLRGRMRAKKAEVPVWNNEVLNIDQSLVGLPGSPTRVVKVFTPPAKEGGKIFDGEAAQSVEQLVEELGIVS